MARRKPTAPSAVEGGTPRRSTRSPQRAAAELRQRAAAFVGAELDRLEPDPRIPLDHEDPFSLLIAVVLSAQCTDVRVNLTTPILWERFGRGPENLRRPSAEEIREIIRPCGLSGTKSRALRELSAILCDEHDGQVPADWEALERLPGVGHKSASVVMSSAFGIPALPVDTHIHRCAARWGLADGRSVERTEADLKELFPIDRWNRLHLQIIHYARRWCPARGHAVAACPICSGLLEQGLPIQP